VIHFTLDNCSIEIGNIENGSFQELVSSKYQNSKKIIIVDENTHDSCLEYLITTFPSLENAEVMLLPAGEENKVMEVCFQVWQALSEYNISRSDLIINLGGGLVTDVGGFIASVFKRGVSFIHIPTSLLGMVDASIGGKTGINLGSLKNELGVFNHPKAIFIDSRFLHTLPNQELINGFAEIIKHSLVAKKDLWDVLKTIDPAELLTYPDLTNLIAISSGIKIQIVDEDPLEKGIRKVLNFGHTIGHGIEGFCLNTDEPVAHGHAVALGMIAESYISYKLNLLSERELMEICLYISQLYEALFFNEEERKAIIQLISHDKKNSAGNVKMALLKGIGSSTWDVVVNEKLIFDSLIYVESVYQSN
jgi:3-dehydroquinate synthase